MTRRYPKSQARRKNKNAVALGRLGGKKKSEAKTAAARANIRKRWAMLKTPSSPVADKRRDGP
jgi:hypothetical protein